MRRIAAANGPLLTGFSSPNPYTAFARPFGCWVLCFNSASVGLTFHPFNQQGTFSGGYLNVVVVGLHSVVSLSSAGDIEPPRFLIRCGGGENG